MEGVNERIGAALVIVDAVKGNDYDYMFRLIPEGVEYKTYKYKCAKDLNKWTSREDLINHIFPVQEILKDLCLQRASYILRSIVGA